LEERKLEISQEQRQALAQQRDEYDATKLLSQRKNFHTISALIATIICACIAGFESSAHALHIAGPIAVLTFAFFLLTLAINRTKKLPFEITKAFSLTQLIFVISGLVISLIGSNLATIYTFQPNPNAPECHDIVFCETSKFTYWIEIFVAGVICIFVAIVLVAIANAKLIKSMNQLADQQPKSAK
jgi:hypothetical protein